MGRKESNQTINTQCYTSASLWTLDWSPTWASNCCTRLLIWLLSTICCSWVCCILDCKAWTSSFYRKHMQTMKLWYREYYVNVFWYQIYQARLRERLLTSRGLQRDSSCVLEADPGKLDIKRRELGILFISLQRWFTLQSSEYDVMINFCVDSASLATSFKKCNVIMTR